jgi:putative ABC transport system permease protein
MMQFLGESSLVALFSACIAAGLFSLGLPLLNELSGKGYSIAQNVSTLDILTVLGIAVITGILGGLYPALVMSGYRSVDVLKGAFRSTRSGARLRKTLVAFQFAISIALIAGTGIIVRQLDFMRSVDLGFDHERMLIVAMQNLPAESLTLGAKSVKDAFLARSEVMDASVSGSIPGRGSGRVLFGGDGIADDDIRSANVMSVGYDYFENYHIKILAGRALSEQFPSDVEQSILMSKSAVDYLGWGTPQEALGKHIDFGEGPREVVGVIADYHHASVKEAVEPMLFAMFPGSIDYLSLRLAPGDMVAARAAVDQVWEKLFPGQPIDAFFLDQDYNRQYDAEARLQRIFSVFASLAILIACLGLIGLAAFAAQQRTKEIGVRKVLGASVPGVTRLLSGEFLTLVFVGFVIAVPATWYGMNLWLKTFPVQAGTGVVPFVAAGLGALFVALASVSYQSIRAALADPVRALRYE